MTQLRWVTTLVDLVLAAALTLASQVEIWAPAAMPGVADVSGSRPVLAATTLAMTPPLAVRRSAPLAVLVVALGRDGWAIVDRAHEDEPTFLEPDPPRP